MAAEEKQDEISTVQKKTIEEISKEVEEKRLQLEQSLKTEVYSSCFKYKENDYVIFFLKKPEFQIRKMAMDMAIRSITDAAELVLNSCIIKEESDYRVYSEDSEVLFPDIRLGAIMFAQEQISYNINILKKK